ncbi:hypothetical protein ACS0TY_025589 [Phlomoides rotata]
MIDDCIRLFATVARFGCGLQEVLDSMDLVDDSNDSFVCETQMEEIQFVVSNWFDTEEKRQLYLKYLVIWCPHGLQVL